MDHLTQTFLEIGIVGTVLSFIIEAIKNKFGTSSLATKGLTIALSIIVGAGVYFLNGTTAWVAILGVLAAASTIYAFLLK